MLEQVKVAVERKITVLQQQLKPTPDQQPLFDAYAQALRAYSFDSIALDMSSGTISPELMRSEFWTFARKVCSSRLID
jgi:hypothetical protein